MIHGRRVLAVIPARGGSRGVPRKNLREVAGRPLLAYTIDAARQSGVVDRAIVSSDDAEILATARAHGVETQLRPIELARDETPLVEAVLYAVGASGERDVVVLLQPTSPMRAADDIDGAVHHWYTLGAPACVSVCEADQSPYRMFTLSAGATMTPVMAGRLPDRRQDLTPVYLLNGAVYVADIAWLVKQRDFVSESTVAYVMPRERSIDIDSELDLAACERQMLNERQTTRSLTPLMGDTK